MKLRTATVLGALLSSVFLLVTLDGCSDAGGTGSPTAPLPFIPDFSFTWQNRDDATNSYFFDQGDDFGVAMGSLLGDESKLDENDEPVNSPLAGTFSGRNVEFTVDRGDPDFEVDCSDNEGVCVHFAGSFVNDDTIELHSNQDGTVVLIRITG